MSQIDLEACLSYVLANRIIADRFRSKAVEARKLAEQSSETERNQLNNLSAEAERRADLHESIASHQEADMGKICHCPTRFKQVM
jgi:hypothetical protein